MDGQRFMARNDVYDVQLQSMVGTRDVVVLASWMRFPFSCLNGDDRWRERCASRSVGMRHWGAIRFI
jgi:hypothetical protein